MRRVRNLRGLYEYIKVWLFGIDIVDEWEDAMDDLQATLKEVDKDNDVSD